MSRADLFQLVQIVYWLALATWFGGVLFVAMAVFIAAAVTVAIRRGRPLVERRRFLFTFEAVALTCLVIGVFKTVRS